MKPEERKIIEKFHDYLQKELSEYLNSLDSEAVWSWDVKKIIKDFTEEYLNQ